MPYPIMTLMLALLCGCLGAGCQQGNKPLAANPQKHFAGVANPSSNASQVLRSVHYFKLMGRTDLAFRELQEACRQEPDNTKLMNALGSCYDDMGEYAQAQQLYQKVLQIDPDNLAAVNNMGYSHYLAGDWQTAESYYQQVLAKDPRNVGAANNLGLVWCRQGKSREARQLWLQLGGEKQAQHKLEEVLAKLGGSAREKAALTTAALAPPPAAAPPRPPTPASPPETTARAPETTFREETSPQTQAAKERQPTAATARAALPEKSPGDLPMRTPAPAAQPIPVPEADLAANREAPAGKAAAAPVQMAAASPTTAAATMTAPATPPAPEQTNTPESPQTPTAMTPAATPPVVEKTDKPDAPPTPVAKPPVTAKPATPAPVQVAAAPPTDIIPAATPPTQEQTEAPNAPPTPVARPSAAASDTPTPAPATLTAAPPGHPAAVGHAAETAEAADLPAPDLEKVAVEIRNGNGAPEIADFARDLLKGNGLRVRLIGNHIDFGAPETIVYYRPSAQAAAREINRRFFEAGRLEKALDLRGDVDVKVLLGHDILKKNLFFSQFKTTYPRHALQTRTPAGSGPAAAPAVDVVHQRGLTNPAAAATMVNTATLTPVGKEEGAGRPPAKFLEPAAPGASGQNAPEGDRLAIEVRNGTRTTDLARFTQDLLRSQGYRVPFMGNHSNFGARETVIYYRPFKRPAAQELNERFFKAKRLEVSGTLRPGVDIKVVLGRDLFRNSEQFASPGRR